MKLALTSTPWQVGPIQSILKDSVERPADYHLPQCYRTTGTSVSPL